MKNKSSAFTLIELLVVVLIIGILAAVAVPQYQKAVDKAHYTSMLEAVRAIKNAQELYYLANGQYAPTIADLSSVFPAQCNATGSSCGDFGLYQSPNTYVYGSLNRSKTGIGNAYLIYLKQNVVHCYAYKEDGPRGRKLCASMGAKKITAENTECSGNCTIYQF